jgi:hypothetical protein
MHLVWVNCAMYKLFFFFLVYNSIADFWWNQYISLFFTQVFSAFGFVHKLATFEKTAGFQVSEIVNCTSFNVSYQYSLFTEYYLWVGSDSVH